MSEDVIKIIEITREPVELFKILKFEGLAESGGAAKSLIADSQVSVNGTIETRKRRKILSGDIIRLNEQEYTIKLEDLPRAG